MKFFDILASSSHNLWRNKSRTVLTIIAIFIGAFTISLTTAVNTGVNDYIDKQVAIFGTDNSFLEVSKKNDLAGLEDEPSKYDENSSGAGSFAAGMTMKTLSDKDIEKISKIEGVKKAKAWISPNLEYFQGKNDDKFTSGARPAFDGMKLDAKYGKQIDLHSDEYQANIPASFAKSMGFDSEEDAVGKTITLAVRNQVTGEIHTEEAKIVGVLNKSFMQSNTIFFNNSLSDKLYEAQNKGVPADLKNSYMAALVNLEDSYDTDEKLTEVKDALDKEGFAGATVEDQIGAFRDIINAITGALTMFGAIALLAASFGIINTLYMSVQERTREIGLFKAMGLSSGKVFAMFSVEAILIGFWGSVIGYGAAILAGGAINNLATETFLKGLEGFNLTIFTPESALIVCGIIMLIAFLSGTLPSRRAAKQDPIDALRYE